MKRWRLVGNKIVHIKPRWTVDNTNDPRWPLRSILTVTDLRKNPTGDALPHAQEVALMCGHYFVNTYGPESPLKFSVGEIVRCRSCFFKIP